ncbi:MAG: phage major capsid protein [Clostridia bacterium]|nr:phage major capsid protein [Clostridia bacterium]
MKKFLEKLLRTKQEQHKNLTAAIIKAESEEERAQIGATLEALAAEIDELKEKIAEVDEPAGAGEGEGEGRNNGEGAQGANAGAGEGRGVNVVATMQPRGAAAQGAQNVDPRDTQEYRNAFMEYMCRGVQIPAELRATTTTADGSAAIPTTLLNEIVKELKGYGEIYNKVRKLNILGGVKVPILSLMPTATWIGESAASADNKIAANDAVSFNYYGVECKISQTVLVNVTTFAAFQALFAPLAAEAVIKALEIAFVAGDGNNKPLGITADTRVPEKNVISLTAAEFASWGGWKKKVFAKMPKAYRNGEFVMAQGTFDGYIDGMEDKNGQPIGRVNYGIENGETYRFGGKNVMTVEDDIIAPYDSASAGDVVAVFVDWSKYAMNSNLELKAVKWEDHDTNEIKNKVILVCDGKLLDPHGVLIIKKGE